MVIVQISEIKEFARISNKQNKLDILVYTHKYNGEK